MASNAINGQFGGAGAPKIMPSVCRGAHCASAISDTTKREIYRVKPLFSVVVLLDDQWSPLQINPLYGDHQPYRS